MSVTSPRLLPLLLAAGLAACGGGNDPVPPTCVPSAETCNAADDDCDGLVDEEVKNACGGCGGLLGEPGEACENCGTWKCDGQAARCVPAVTVPGTACTGANGCEGQWQCGQDGTVRCAAPEKNECGGCAPLSGKPGERCAGCGSWACEGGAAVCVPPDNLPGTRCTGAGGCEGSWRCDDDGEVRCAAPEKNACGKCGGAVVSGLDEPCVSAEGCSGKKACAASGEAAECQAPAKNACGVCGGPAIANLGAKCVSGDGCEGTLACNASGTAPYCHAPAKNQCGLCGGSSIPEIGTGCTSAQGCAGLWACNAAGTGKVCAAPERNQCDACLPPVAGLGANCTDGACAGKKVCNAAGDGTVCQAPGANNCGACGAANVPGIGEDCTTADGCPGKKVCDAAGTGFSCLGPSKNECGVCGGARIEGLGGSCSSSDGCAGKLVCNQAGTGTACDAPRKNDCGLCGGPALEELGADCLSAEGCAGLRVCDSAGTGTRCGAPAKNVCGLCGGPALPDFGKSCAAGTCNGNWACNGLGNGLLCEATNTNNCGVCGAPDVPGLGEDCLDPTGCAGKKVCDSAGTSWTCQASAKNVCGLCGGPAVTGLGLDCVNAFGCAGKTVCNPAGDGAFCDPTPACGSASHLVISEVCGSGSVPDPITGLVNDTDELVELHNPTASTLNLTGVTLWYRTSTGTTFLRLATFPAGTTIGPKRYLLLGKKPSTTTTGYVGPPAADFLYAAANLPHVSGGQLWLTATPVAPADAADPTLVDLLGWGLGTLGFEGAPAAKLPKAGASLERKANALSTGWDPLSGNRGTMGPGGGDETAGNGRDSNDNSQDFVHREVRDPQNLQSAPEGR